MSQATRTTLNRTWKIKMGVFFIFLAGLGSWGYYDATVKWPARGVRHAEWAKWQYLGVAIDTGYASRTSVPDPVAEFERLNDPAKLAEIRSSEASAAGTGDMDRLEFTRHRWLKSLKRVGRLDPQYTLIEDPRDTFRDLDETWLSGTMPKPLAAYDIMMQWVITIAGFGGALFMLGLYVTVARHRYTFDPEALALTLPGGVVIKPSDIDVFDKRKWHRFLVYLKINEGHKELGGKEIRLDLLRYSPLETWAKQMFKAAHPDEYRESFPDEFAEPTTAESLDDKADEQDGAGESEQGEKADSAASGD
jgi:hypothetical protein